MAAIVKSIQVKGAEVVHNLGDACFEFIAEVDNHRDKLNFCIELPNGTLKSITIRDEGDRTVAYGDFEELPSFLDYSKDVVNAKEEASLIREPFLPHNEGH